MDITYFVKYIIPQLGSGVCLTVELMICALIAGFLLAALLTWFIYTNSKILNAFVTLYTFFIRGTPLLVQIFIIYYGSSQFDFLRNSILWNVLKQPFFCAVAALAINTSAYSVELFRGAINSIPPGEIEACHALGMTKFQMLRHIIVKRAFGIVLPAYSNEVIIILKSTSLTSTITLMELMGITQQLIANTYFTLTLLAISGVIYLFLNLILMKILRMLERRVSAYLVSPLSNQ